MTVQAVRSDTHEVVRQDVIEGPVVADLSNDCRTKLYFGRRLEVRDGIPEAAQWSVMPYFGGPWVRHDDLGSVVLPRHEISRRVANPHLQMGYDGIDLHEYGIIYRNCFFSVGFEGDDDDNVNPYTHEGYFDMTQILTDMQCDNFSVVAMDTNNNPMKITIYIVE